MKTTEQRKIESLMRDVDRTLLRENRKLTPSQRLVMPAAAGKPMIGLK